MSVWKQKVSNGGGDFDTAPAGSHPAVLVALVDLGTQQEEYKGVSKLLRKVFLAWELPNEAKPGGGGNFVVGRDYTLSFGQSATLRSVIEKWRGQAFKENEEFDLSVLVGKPCLLTLVHKVSGQGRTYAKIDGVTQLPKPPKGKEKDNPPPKATVTPILWTIDSGDPIPDAPWLPYVYGEPLRQVIERSQEYGTAAPDAGDAAEEPDDETEPIPF